MIRSILIVLSLSAIVAVSYAQQCGSCVGLPPQPQTPRYEKVWNEAALKRYSMSLKEAGTFRADLTAKTLQTLISTAKNPDQFNYAPMDAVRLADATMIHMGLIELKRTE